MTGAVESRGGVSQWEQQAKTLLRSSLNFQLCRSVPSAGWAWHNWQLTKPYNCHVINAHDEQHEHEKGTDFIGVELAGARSAKRKQGEADGSNDAKGVPAKTSRLSSRRNADKTSGKSDSVICSTAGDVSQPNDTAKVPFTCPLCACASQDKRCSLSRIHRVPSRKEIHKSLRTGCKSTTSLRSSSEQFSCQPSPNQCNCRATGLSSFMSTEQS